MRSLNTYILLLGISVPISDCLAQQGGLPPGSELKIQGVDQLSESVRRIELQLQQFANLRWEYRFLQRNRLQSTEEILTQLGAEGWELVGVTVEEGYILKRPVWSR